MRRNLSFILAVMLLSTPAFAAIEVETTRLGHGVSVWYAANNRVPVVDVVLSFEGAGSASDAEGKSGRAAFAASLLNEGAGDLDSASFQRTLEEHAITLQASTDHDRLQVHVHCLREDAPRAGELLALALSRPRLDPADQARIKEELGGLLQRLDESAGYQAQRLLEKRAFAGHPYASPPYGTPESIAGLDGQDVRDFMKTYITRGNVTVAAAGDVDSSLLDQMLGPVIEALPENDAGAVAVTPITLQGGGENLQRSMPLPQSVVVFAAPAIARDDKRFYAAYLLNHILGGSALDSRLAQLRRQNGLVYNIDTDLDIRSGSVFFYGSLATRNHSVEAAIAQAKTVLGTLREKGVTTQECADAKSYVLGALPRQLDSSSAVTSMLLTMQIQHLGREYLDERTTLFNRVSCGDINTLAAELLAPEHFLFATVGGTADGPAPMADVPADAR
ncbi:MAG: M16 family metallopeptidase [Rickettsiales bacterium]